MKTLAKMLSAAALLAAVAAPTIANAAYGRSFTLVNGNGSTAIQRVWFALAGVPGDPWKLANMNGAPVGANSSSVFTLSAGTACYYDIKVEFGDGYTQTIGSVNVCTGQRAIAN